MNLPPLVKPNNQLIGCVFAGPHVKAHSQLKDEDKSEEAITDAFLTMFAEVVKPHWNLLAPYIISNNYYDLTGENALHQLRAWKAENKPTHGDMYEILNQLILNPVVIPQDGIFKGSLKCIFIAKNCFNMCIPKFLLQIKIPLVTVKMC